MKRVFAVLLSVISLMAFASAETFRLNEGTYVIGEDIPEGPYEIGASVWGICQMEKPDGSDVHDLVIHDAYYLKEGYVLRVDLYTATLRTIELNAKQKESPYYADLLRIRLEAESMNWEGLDVLRYSLPSGTYVVGVDIPEGCWQVRYFSTMDCTFTVYQNGKATTVTITSPRASHYDPTKSIDNAYFLLQDGDRVIVGQSLGGLFLIPFKSIGDK